MKSRFAINTEFAAVRVFEIAVNLVPYRVAMALASMLGFFAVRVLRFKRRRTFERIRGVFPGIADGEVKEIATRSFVNLLKTGVEMMRSPRLDRKWMDRYVVEGDKYASILKDLLAEGNGVVIMVPHSGNWYMAAWAMAAYGVKLFSIAARQRNPKLDGWMNAHYREVEVLDRDNKSTLIQIKEKLKSGKAFAILPDLRVRKHDVEADFLGGRANVSHSGAAFAVRYNAPIVVAAMRRKGGRHVFDYIETLRPDPSAEDRKTEAVRLTRAVMALLDGEVRKHPGEWFWYNKRWILEPVVV